MTREGRVPTPDVEDTLPVSGRGERPEVPPPCRCEVEGIESTPPYPGSATPLCAPPGHFTNPIEEKG